MNDYAGYQHCEENKCTPNVDERTFPDLGILEGLNLPEIGENFCEDIRNYLPKHYKEILGDNNQTIPSSIPSNEGIERFFPSKNYSDRSTFLLTNLQAVNETSTPPITSSPLPLPLPPPMLSPLYHLMNKEEGMLAL